VVPVSRDLVQRLGIAVIGIPILLFIFYFDGLVLCAFLALVSFLGMWEYNIMLSKANPGIQKVDILISVTIYALFCSIIENEKFEFLIIMILFILLMMRFVLRSFKIENPDDFKLYLRPLVGWFYTGALPGLVFTLGQQYKTQKYLLLLLVLIWITDSAAYFIGMKFGYHRGIFRVSPRKSLEGFIAGILAPMVFCAILYYVTDLWSLTHLILLALCAGILGQVGDLFESKLKRIGKVKDSSNIIPGHGGVLDRFDSLLISAPSFLFLIKLFP
jgi:phosphatidate cytidylyltransferase